MSVDDSDSGQQAVQYVLYDSDLVEVTYADGSCIHLSPCGSTFVSQQPLAVNRQHPVNGISIIKHFDTCVV